MSSKLVGWESSAEPVWQSVDDATVFADFRAARMAPAELDHAMHVRVAYVYLQRWPLLEALRRFRSDLQHFLAHHGVPASKYHETLTSAWMLAVHAAMTEEESHHSGDLLAQAPDLLRADCLLAYYSEERLYSAEARQHFLLPDLQTLPFQCLLK